MACLAHQLFMREQLEVPLSLVCMFLPRGPRRGSSGSRWWWGRVAHLDSMSTGNASHSALTLPSPATAILNPPPPIRVSELSLLTAVTGPAQGDNGGRVGLPLCWGVTSVWILGIAAWQSEPSDSVLWSEICLAVYRGNIGVFSLWKNTFVEMTGCQTWLAVVIRRVCWNYICISIIKIISVFP